MTKHATLGIWSCLALGCSRDVIVHEDGDGGEASTSGASDPSAEATDDDGEDSTSSSTDDGADTTGGPPPAPGEGTFGGGTRLTAVVERTEDGNEMFLRWFDNELGIECSFARDSEGTLRCLPLPVNGLVLGYADVACGEPILGATTCSDVPTYVRGPVLAAAACAEGQRQQAFLRGVPLGGGVVQRYGELQGTCEGSNSFDQRYAVTPVDDDTFLAAVAVEEDVDGVRVRAIVADDGSYVRNAVIDPRTGLVCRSAYFGDGQLWCSSDTWLGLGYSGDACGVPLFAFPDDGTCREPAVIPVRTQDGWFTLGEPWAGTIYEPGEECVEAQLPELFPYSLRPIGDAIDEPTAYTLPLAIHPDDVGRVRRYGVIVGGTFVAAELYVQEQSRWYDTVLDQPCLPMIDIDGARRCLPESLLSPYRRDNWGDPACEEIPLYVTVESDMPAQVTHVLDAEETCGETIAEALQNVVGPWTDPVYRLDPQDGCVPEEIDEFDHVYRLGNYALLLDAPLLEVVSSP